MTGLCKDSSAKSRSWEAPGPERGERKTWMGEDEKGFTHRVLPSCLHRVTKGCSRLLYCILVCVCAHAWVLSCSFVSNSLWPYGLYPTRLLYPWNFPGKNTGVGCRFLLQGSLLTQGSNLYHLCWQASSLPHFAISLVWLGSHTSDGKLNYNNSAWAGTLKVSALVLLSSVWRMLDPTLDVIYWWQMPFIADQNSGFTGTSYWVL